MKVHLLFSMVFLLSGLIGCASAQRLLDQKLTQFENVYSYGEAKLENGELHLIAEKNWFYSTKAEYDDFILEAEVKMPDTTEFSNSGIIFRGQIEETENGRRVIGYQAEIDPSERRWTGGLFDQGRRKWLYPVHPTRSHRDEDFLKNHLGEWGSRQSEAYKHLAWNKLKIVCRGTDIKIFVNGILTTHVEDAKDSAGVIAFQHHGSEIYQMQRDKRNAVRFRNITVRPF
ncbi:DUF1080 domain-containing protein [Aestuariibacter sp. A3R04]|uniref:3-keto-disaccharide hydrolase n=1 Tax=Aestuariibacter sp. A3R04 TaxID=2841571 RepID=UPI001C082E4F|nr:DUF1080 domain-containing protein [Aestuariibacter sp. A3R04]MBU3020415.1 DUF1080 domain-containing protein [Aestuariibacter sp. A3R04]